MSMVEALARYNEDQTRQSKSPSAEFSMEKISFAVVLSPDGEVIDVQSLQNTQGKIPRARPRMVPNPVKRTSKVIPNFLWDKTGYVFGIKKDGSGNASPVARGEHKAFADLHLRVLEGTRDEGLEAVRQFAEKWTGQAEDYNRLRYAEEMLDTNVVFKLEGGEDECVHERPAARTAWLAELGRRAEPEVVCLATGKRGPGARIHPAIKGIPGGQSSGTSLVSFNCESFESYGWSQGENARMLERTAESYTAAINTMLNGTDPQRIRIGSTAVVYWTECPDEGGNSEANGFFKRLLEPPPTAEGEIGKVEEALGRVARGKAYEEVGPDVHPDTRINLLGLSANAARVSIRFWHTDTMGGMTERLADHWRDLRLDPLPWTRPPSVHWLLRETAPQRNTDKIQPSLADAVMRAILTGGRYPKTLLHSVITRTRAERNVTGLQAALCKACITRDTRLNGGGEDTLMSLNREDEHPGYLLGRLFAAYEGVQKAALGNNINSTIRDKYYGAASAAPASVFPQLARKAVHHIATIRKDKGGLAHWFDQEIDSIIERLGSSFPKTLRIEDQGRFAIGYHHQHNAERPKKANDKGEENE